MTIFEPGGLVKAILNGGEPTDPSVAWGYRLREHLDAVDRCIKRGDEAGMNGHLAKADFALDWLADTTPETIDGMLAIAVGMAGAITSHRATGDSFHLSIAERCAYALVDALETKSMIMTREMFGAGYFADPQLDPRGCKQPDA